MTRHEWNAEIDALLRRRCAGGALPAMDISDIAEEWAQHAEAAWAAARAEGLSESDARARVRTQIEAWCANLAAAPRRRGAPLVIQPPAASSRGMTGLWQDVKYGCRVLLKQPGFAFVAAATTALAIGATTTLFSVADGVLTRPLPFPDAERLIRPTETREGATRQLPSLITQVTYQLWRDKPATIEGIAGFSSSPATVGQEDGSQRILGFRA